MKAGIVLSVLAAAGALLFLAVGCGDGETSLAPVRGTVRYKGEPLRGGTIVFAPDPERGGSGPIAHADIQPDGSYVLHTEGAAGAVPGWHRVTVAQPPTSGPPPSLPAHYADPELSGQCHEVRPGRSNVIDIKLE